MANLKFDIIEQFGTLSTSKSGWELQLNLVQWGENTPKFDLRTWSPDHQKMGKGITLTHEDLVNLDQVLQKVLAPEKNGDNMTTFEVPIQFEEPVASEDDGYEAPVTWKKMSDL